MHCRPLPSLVCLLAPLAALAQSPIPVESAGTFAPLNTQVPADGLFLRCLPGYLGAGGDRDLLLVYEKAGARTAVYLQDPMQHNITVTVQSGIVDATVLRTGGDRDLVAVLAAGGLTVYCDTDGNQTLDVVTTLGGLWAGATGIWAGSDAAGHPVVLGVRSDGYLLRAIWNGTAFSSLSGPTLLPGVTQLETMNYDGVGEVELVARVGDGVFVLDWSGVATAYFTFAPSSTGSKLLTVSRGSGTAAESRDLLVMYGEYQYPAVNGFLQYCVFAANSSGGLMRALGLQVAASSMVACRELAANTCEDLLLADGASTSRVYRLKRVLTPALFSATLEYSQHVVGPTRPVDAMCCVCGADLDGDGDADLVAMQPTTHCVSIAAGAAMPSTRCLGPVIAPVTANGYQLDLTCEMLLPTLPILQSGEHLEMQFLGWVKTTASAPGELVASLQDAKLLPGGNKPSFSLHASLAAALASDWSIELRYRLVIVGANGSRHHLAPMLVHYSPNTSEVGLARAWRDEAIGLLGEDGGTGDPNTTGGSGPPRNGPPRTP